MSRPPGSAEILARGIEAIPGPTWVGFVAFVSMVLLATAALVWQFTRDHGEIHGGLFTLDIPGWLGIGEVQERDTE